MSFEAGPFRGGSRPARRFDAASSPAPIAVREAIGAAAARAAELHAADRELNFRTDALSGRLVVEVRDLAGNVVRTIKPSEALAVMAGAAI